MADSKQDSQPTEATSKVSRDERNLVVSFIQFLRQKVSANECSNDQIEAIEVAVQCLETAFTLTDKNYAFQASKPLIEIFKASEGGSATEEEFTEPTKAEIEQANKLKEEGNELVKASKFNEAVQKYNEAIKLNRDPIYFCNRAAAYCRLEKNDLAIQDCRTALALDPDYAKAYGRMGVALSCQNRYNEAVEAYKRAVELDPQNDSYKSNLAIAEEKLRESTETGAGETGGFPGGFPGLGGLGAMGGMGGLGGLFNNPQMQQMASQMMSDPNIQNMMSQMMGAFSGPGAPQPGEGAQGAPSGGPGLENLMRVGEQIAETLSQQNPELVEQLRQQFNNARGPSGERHDDNQPPPSNQ